MTGDLRLAEDQLRQVAAEAEAAHDPMMTAVCTCNVGQMQVHLGEISAARATLGTALEMAEELRRDGLLHGVVYGALALAALAVGDVAAAADASREAWQRMPMQHGLGSINPLAEIALARGDLSDARRWADNAVSARADQPGWYLAGP